jgi:hypothetical protein
MTREATSPLAADGWMEGAMTSPDAVPWPLPVLLVQATRKVLGYIQSFLNRDKWGHLVNDKFREGIPSIVKFAETFKKSIDIDLAREVGGGVRRRRGVTPLR